MSVFRVKQWAKATPARRFSNHTPLVELISFEGLRERYKINRLHIQSLRSVSYAWRSFISNRSLFWVDIPCLFSALVPNKWKTEKERGKGGERKLSSWGIVVSQLYILIKDRTKYEEVQYWRKVTWNNHAKKAPRNLRKRKATPKILRCLS